MTITKISTPYSGQFTRSFPAGTLPLSFHYQKEQGPVLTLLVGDGKPEDFEFVVLGVGEFEGAPKIGRFIGAAIIRGDSAIHLFQVAKAKSKARDQTTHS